MVAWSSTIHNGAVEIREQSVPDQCSPEESGGRAFFCVSGEVELFEEHSEPSLQSMGHAA
jgi:hypothetical protein